MIESEIFKFRTRTGIYRVTRRQHKHHSAEYNIQRKEARKLFSDELIKVWKSLEVSEMKLGALHIPKENTMKDKVNDKDKEDIILDRGENAKQLDKCGKLSVENYVKTRLRDQLDKYKHLSPWLKRCLQKQFSLRQRISNGDFDSLHLVETTKSTGSIIAHLTIEILSVCTLICCIFFMAFIAAITSIMEQKQFICLRLSASNGVQMQLSPTRIALLLAGIVSD